MLSARLAASVARNLPRSAQQVRKFNKFNQFFIKLAIIGEMEKLHNNYLTFLLKILDYNVWQ